MTGSLRRKVPDPEASRDAANPTAVHPAGLTFASSAKPLATERRASWEAREVMDIRQAAEYLGISSDSLYKYASENVIPAFKLGNRWRFKRSLLDGWMEHQSLLGSVTAVEGRVKPRQKKPVSRVR